MDIIEMVQNAEGLNDEERTALLDGVRGLVAERDGGSELLAQSRERITALERELQETKKINFKLASSQSRHEESAEEILYSMFHGERGKQ